MTDDIPDDEAPMAPDSNLDSGPAEQTPKSKVTPDQIRMLEAVLFAAKKPLNLAMMADRMPSDADLPKILEELQHVYANRGINLVARGKFWLFQTAPDLSFLLSEEVDEVRKLSRAATETLAIIAYHQPTTRAEIEEIRGVALSKGTLDLLMEAGWVKPKGRRQSPGRPVTYGTSEDFLVHFGLESLDHLPGKDELKAAGLLDPVQVALSAFMANAGAAEQDEASEGPLFDQEDGGAQGSPEEPPEEPDGPEVQLS